MASDTLDLKIDVAEPEGWGRRLTITVPADRVQRERDTVVQRIRKRARLPGFRQGRVPASVLQRQFGDAIQSETVERLVDAAYRQALSEKGFEPISQGHVDRVDYSPGADLTFDVHFEVKPQIELGRLGGFVVQRAPAAVGEEQVDQVVERLRTEQAEWRKLEEGRPASGDRVAVQITPLKEDEAVETAKPRRYQIVLGQGQAIADVEAAIQTLEVGMSGEFVISVPADESEGAEPEEQRVQVELLELERPDLAEVDDDFARGLGDFESLQQLRDRIREDLQRESDSEAESEVRRRLLDQVIEANAFDVPESMIARYVEQLFGGEQKIPAERRAELLEAARPAAERALRRSMVVERVAEMHGLRPSEEEVDARVEQVAERSGRPVAEVWSQLQRSGRLERIENDLLEDKVFEYLKSQSEITETAPGSAAEAKGKAKRKTKK